MNPAINTRLPGLWVRAVAAIIDSALLEGLNWFFKIGVIGIFSAFIRNAGADPKQIITGFLELEIEMGLYILISFPYFVWGNFRYGTTLGKIPFGIFVRDRETGHSITLKQSIYRYLGYGLSYLTMGGGFVMILFQKDRRGLHDMVAGTQCWVEKKIPVVRIEEGVV